MRVAVTGGSGHIGGNLVQGLIEAGHEVRALVREDTRALEGFDVELVQGDVRDPESLEKAFAGVEIVYHLAAKIVIYGGDPKLVEDINVGGPRNVAAACRKMDVRRMVHFSSIHAILEEPLDSPLDETRDLADTLKKPRLYDRTKAMGQREVEKAVTEGLDAVIINCGAVLGRRDFKPSNQGQMILDLVAKKIPALVPGGYTWVDVRDVVAGAMSAAEKGRKGERYLLTGNFITMKEMSAIVGEITGVKTAQAITPFWLATIGAPFVGWWSKMRGRTPLFTRESISVLKGNCCMNNDKACGELDFDPRSLREMLEDTVAWFDEAGMLKKKGQK